MNELEESRPSFLSAYCVREIDKRIEALHFSCDLPPIAAYIGELGCEFENRMKTDQYFNIGFFKKKLSELKKTIEFDFNRFGVDSEKARSGYYHNRMIFEVHNTTTFTIRYFSCKDLANAFISKRNDDFKLARVFNTHHEIVHTPYF